MLGKLLIFCSSVKKWAQSIAQGRPFNQIKPEHNDSQNQQHGYQNIFLPGRTMEATEASD